MCFLRVVPVEGSRMIDKGYRVPSYLLCATIYRVNSRDSYLGPNNQKIRDCLSEPDNCLVTTLECHIFSVFRNTEVDSFVASTGS